MQVTGGGFHQGKECHTRRTRVGQKRIFVGQHLLAREFYGSTVGRNEAARDYVRQQKEEDKRLDQISLWR